MANRIEAVIGEQTINIGIKEKDRKVICKGLSKLLADSYFLYLKTQNFHWNVTGKMFTSLHQMFENQYQELSPSLDQIAERIRALGEFAPGSFSSFTRLTNLKEENGVLSAEQMVQNLITDHETVIRTAREVARDCDEAEDDVTIDLMVDRMNWHEKNAWMLRSVMGATRSH